jgi:hypothetical protein
MITLVALASQLFCELLLLTLALFRELLLLTLAHLLLAHLLYFPCPARGTGAILSTPHPCGASGRAAAAATRAGT